MAKRPKEPSGSWREHVRPGREHSRVFSSAQITVGAIHMAGIIAGILAADKMKSPSARWSAIAGFGIATGIGEGMWRNHVEHERGTQKPIEPE